MQTITVRYTNGIEETYETPAAAEQGIHERSVGSNFAVRVAEIEVDGGQAYGLDYGVSLVPVV